MIQEGGGPGCASDGGSRAGERGSSDTIVSTCAIASTCCVCFLPCCTFQLSHAGLFVPRCNMFDPRYVKVERGASHFWGGGREKKLRSESFWGGAQRFVLEEWC